MKEVLEILKTFKNDESKFKEEESLKEIVKVEFKKEDGDRDCTK